MTRPMSRTRSRTLEGRRALRRLAWALLLALTGCAPCLTDSQCARQYPGTFGDPVPATDSTPIFSR